MMSPIPTKRKRRRSRVSREEDMGISDEVCAASVVHSVTTKESSEIVPVVEEVEEKLVDRSLGQFKRSLAECLSTDDEWSALEGIARNDARNASYTGDRQMIIVD
ncbi:putative protein phosphatase 2C 66 [Forsythia ovata]|uniref:Uncharacterized protein n=1 Tax=Forsythia ovata TaxID=205694 RepID=A0ABD1S7D7_9LAMI